MRPLIKFFRGLSEAGVAHGPTKGFKSAEEREAEDGDPDGDEQEAPEASGYEDDTLGPESGADDGQHEAEPVEDEDQPEEPAEDDVFGGGKKFASQSEPPKRRSEEEVTGLTISGADPATLQQLSNCLAEHAERFDDDVADWIDGCVSAISAAMRRHGSDGEITVKIPKFEQTPSLDDFDDDAGDTEDEDY